MARKRVIKKKETMKAAAEKAQLAENKKTPEVSEATKEIKAAEVSEVSTVKKKENETKKPVAKKTETKKTEVKKNTVKKTVKKEMKVKTFVEYYGKQVEEKEMIARVKKAWTRKGKRVGEIKTLELYVKPEEGAVYYVINGKETGAVEY